MAQSDSLSYAPRGMPRDEAAWYVGLTPPKFDCLVADGRMPNPKQVDGHLIWDRLSLDAAFTALPIHEQDDNTAAVGTTTAGAHLPEVFSARTLAAYWMCSEHHIRNLCESGALPSFKLGEKLLRIRRADVERHEISHEIQPATQPLEKVTDPAAAKPKMKRAARLDITLIRPARLKS